MTGYIRMENIWEELGGERRMTNEFLEEELKGRFEAAVELLETIPKMSRHNNRITQELAAKTKELRKLYELLNQYEKR